MGIARSTWEIALLGIILPALFITAITGNLLVIYGIRTDHRLYEQAASIFIINLCCSDLLSALLVMTTSFVAVVFDLHVILTGWCNFVCAVNYCLIIVSMLTLALISIERLIAVVYPLQYHQWVKPPILIGMSLYTWIQGSVFGSIPILMKWIHYDYWEAICAIDWHQGGLGALWYVIIAFSLNFGIPGIVMLGCYIAIMREVRHLNKVCPSGICSVTSFSPEASPSRKAIKTISSLLVLVTFFVISMTPFSITKLLKVIRHDTDAVPAYVNILASLFGYLSSVANPFIYAIFRKEFRVVFLAVIDAAWKKIQFDGGMN